MVSFKVFVFIAISTIGHQSVCEEDTTKDILFENEVTNSVIMAFRDMIFGVRKSETNPSFEKQLTLYSTATFIKTLLREISKNVENSHELALLSTALYTISVLFDKIDTAYSRYLDIKASQTDASDPSTHSFLQQTRNPYQGPLDYINTIYSTVLPKSIEKDSEGVGYNDDVSVLVLLYEHMQSFERVCDKHKSQQNILQNLYTSVSTATMKVYTVMEYCYKELSIFKECNYENEMKSLNETLSRKANETAVLFEYFMRRASREVWRCDPKIHVENVTYSQLYYVFQKFIAHDEDLNEPNDCSKTCSSVTKGHVTHCRNDEWHGLTSICNQQRDCQGDLHDCEDYFRDQKEIWICPSSTNSSSRYEYIDHGTTNMLTFGINVEAHYGREANMENCSRTVAYDYGKNGQSFADMINYCEICLCTCLDWRNPSSDRYLNFRPAVANNDYIVTGVRLVKENNTLHIQIKQGKLLAGGIVDKDTISWKPIAAPRNIYDLRSISYENFNEVYLGVTEVPKGRVIVGVKLSNLKTNYTTMLGIKTLSVPYDIITGKLTYETAYYIEPEEKANIYEPEFDPLPDLEQNPLPTESKVNLENCDVPINTMLRSVPQPESKKFLKFTTSDFKKNLGQNTIPYLDVQSVVVRPAVPLTAIAFYHKYRPDYGGFLGLKLLTYDQSTYIN